MKTETNNSRKDSESLRTRSNNFKTSCLGVLVAKKGFTLAELITVVVIIAILLGILMPALSQVKKIALEAKQKAQITSIEVGINMYRNDFGAYPPSHGTQTATESVYYYCGAQTLTEAMFGWDLLGVHQNSIFRADGQDNSGNNLYPPGPNSTELNARKEPYLDRTNIGVFTPRQIFNQTSFPAFPGGLDADRYVICDVFSAASREINGKSYKVGTPVLYFQANLAPVNTQGLIIASAPPDNKNNIYNYMDNNFLIELGKMTNTTTAHPLYTPPPYTGEPFYKYIVDPMIPAASGTVGMPVRKDTFLLISAGFDGLYGTKDDICNFNPNVQ
ncbi:MAG: prepilin-type N-terminal cleavage/methylation domain-containing protein [Sedimentisphaerales bacterium]